MKKILSLFLPITLLIVVISWFSEKDAVATNETALESAVTEQDHEAKGSKPIVADMAEEAAKIDTAEGSDQNQLESAKLAKSTDDPEPESSESDTSKSILEDPIQREKELAEPIVEIPLSEEQEPSPPIHAFNLMLPTDNEKIFDTPEQFYMHTNRYVNGVNTRPWRGGTYGFVRNQRWEGYDMYFTRLHEGIDIKPVYRDDNQEPLDKVCAISDGTVVYSKPDSSGGYGRYIVVKHNWQEGSFYSLYGHLSQCIATVDAEVKAGDTLGVLGYSGRGLNRERAHLHLELNFLMSEQYHLRWSPGNRHNNYSGLNMIGLNIERLFLEHRKDPDINLEQFLTGEDSYFKVKSVNPRRPGLLDRHPWLGKNMEKAPNAKGWEWTFTREGVPIAIEPFTVYQQYTNVSWVKPVKANHSLMTSNRITGYGDNAYLSDKGHRFIALFCEAF